MSGWFVDWDPEMKVWQYQPVLELEDGTCLSLEIHFKTEGECQEFIAKDILRVASKVS